MRRRVDLVLHSVKAAALRIPRRARWSFIDQLLISGVNVLTAILLVRVLGLHEFGVFSLTLIGVQFLAGFHAAGILAPMMSLYDQRGLVSQSSYLAAVLLHEAALCAVATALLVFASLVPQVSSVLPIDVGLAIAVVVSTQFQDLSRRFFYVTERPVRAVASDVVAYGARLAIIALFAFEGGLTIDRVWIAIAGTSTAALLLLVPNLVHWRASWLEIKDVTERHWKMAGWLIGNTVIGWFSASDFILLTVGTVLGPVQLGAVRAVQNLVNLANLLLQALENFVPSAATQSLTQGGPASLLRYIGRVSSLGAGAIVAVTALLMLFADPILQVMYGRTFPHQVAILAILGSFASLGYVVMVVYAGLRALRFIRSAFFAEAAVAAVSLATAWPIATEWGVVGSLLGLLVARLALAGQLVLLFRRKASAVLLEYVR